MATIAEALELAEATIMRLDKHGSAVGTLDVIRAVKSQLVFTTFDELLEYLASYGKVMANFVYLLPDESELNWRDVPTTVEDFLELNGHELKWWFGAAMEGAAYNGQGN